MICVLLPGMDTDISHALFCCPQDLVIGAPYELEDGMRRGAVYIYPGSANGLESIPMQRITPLQIDPLSKVISFGSVLAKGWDIDNNSYSGKMV